METIMEHLCYLDLTELKLIQIEIERRIQLRMRQKQLAAQLWPTK